MKTWICMMMLSGMALAGLNGCASIPAAIPGNTTMTGEAWYAKVTVLGFAGHGLVLSSKIFYCDGKGPVCKEATIKD